MFNLKDIRNIHLELTTKCQARCPMCPRRINGGPLNPLFDLTEIDIDTFKNWFPVDFVKQLDRLFMCGNLGDPIIAQDCLEILSYLRESNPTIQLSMHTNGSARTRRFWEQIAELKVRVTFGIDGLEDTHKLYRIDTDFNIILKNANTFIRHGGVAEWHMLVFKHNEHQIDDCQKLANDMGFSKFQTKHTSRFVNDKFHVLNDEGKTVNVIYPSDKSKKMIPLVQESLSSVNINCKAKHQQEIYVSANGSVSPCCWLDLSWQLAKQDNRIDYMDQIGKFPSLRNNTLQEIFDSEYFKTIESTWNNKPLLECSKQCGEFNKLKEQFK